MRTRPGCFLLVLVGASASLVLLSWRWLSARPTPLATAEVGTIRCQDGHMVRSFSERRIDDELWRLGLVHEYEPDIRGGGRFRADFRLTQSGVYIEYWGLSTPEYLGNRKRKMVVYSRENLRLIELWWPDAEDIEAALNYRIRQYGVL